ncbi:MAG: hypothetical protein AAGC71_14080 [Pseudomonadota bacterium]
MSESLITRQPIALAKIITSLCLVIGLSGCPDEQTLEPFTSDGCSLFPDRAEAFDQDWCHCCVEHDIAYWKGGTRAEREAADRTLQSCVADSTGSESLARLMYEGVRSGGRPEFPTWYRWGYGWSDNRGYQALSNEQSRQAESILMQYRDSVTKQACGSDL